MGFYRLHANDKLLRDFLVGIALCNLRQNLLLPFREGLVSARMIDPSAGLSLEELDNIEGVVILGGPMSVYQEESHPWLIQEKQFIREAIRHRLKVLGICLGAQLLAEALGGRVYRHTQKEIDPHIL